MVTLTVTLLLVLAGGVYLGLGARPNLGLDLQGGVSAIYTPQLPQGQEQPEDFEDIIDETIEVIRARVDSLGVAEPDISREGTDVLVQLPGVTDPDRLREIIGTTAQLTFRPMHDTIGPDDPRYDADPGDEVFDETRSMIAATALFGADPDVDPEAIADDVELFEVNPDCDAPPDERPELPDDAIGIVCGNDTELVPDPENPEELVQLKHLVGRTALTGDRINDAFPQIGGGGGFVVGLDLDSEGGRQFAEITAQLACERDATAGQSGLLAIVMDGRVESAPTMSEDVACGVGITGGNAIITTGQGLSLEEQEQEARDLALILRTGALPISLEPSTFETVSATLGEESLQSGLLAGAIGLLLVSIWLIYFYRWLGLVALAALAVFGILTMTIISLLGNVGFALTLAGVAGLIVAIGITADSSIIFFERIRDEVNLGKTVRTATTKAFKSAFRTNLAGNTVTAAAAAILYFLAVGPVRGFALMLGMATVLDIFILYFFTRPVVGLMSTTKLMSRRAVRAAERVPVPAGGVR